MTTYRMRGAQLGMLALVALLGAAHAANLGLHRHISATLKRPVWPDSYEMGYTIELPYVASLQPTPLKYDVHVWYDGTNDLLRTSFYHGMDETIVTEDTTYNIYPRITTRSCLVYNHTTGPTLGNDDTGVVPPLPDISEEWVYGGTAHLANKPPTDIWQLSYRMDEKVNTYTFHVAQGSGKPVSLHMVGVNLFTGSHYDQYDVEFTLFRDLANVAPFQPPALCKDAASLQLPVGAPQRHVVLQQAVGILPSSLVPTGVTSGGRAAHPLAGLQRLWSRMVSALTGQQQEAAHGSADMATVMRNVKFIQEWNNARQQQLLQGEADSDAPVAAADLYKMAVNKFVAWSDEKFATTQLGHLPGVERTHRRLKESGAYLGEYQRVLSDAELPAAVDWRGTGADGPVKDQASCGSCWTFATTGAMTGAWYKATNQSLSFSEQQIVDCSWDYDVNGCWGGNTEPAMEYIKSAGGAVMEAHYPYLGQNGYCKDSKLPKAAVFKGYMSIRKHDEKAVMEAVALHGPLSIAFDAGQPGFKYYSEGVFYSDKCGTHARDLNHAVTLVGYGTTRDGTDYWLLRNSWSVSWGSDGYFKLARKGNDCGVTRDAVLVVPDEEAVAQAVAKMATMDSPQATTAAA